MHLRQLLAAVTSLSFWASSCAFADSATTQSTTLPAVAALSTPLSQIEQSARTDLYWLADDAREGRGLGTKGLEESGQFIADRFQKLGLVPLPEIGGYFQSFDYDAGKKLGPGTKLSVNGKPLPADAFTSFVNSKEGEAAGGVAFVGYGIQSDEHGYDDYADIDVKGRAVLAMRWEPHDASGKSRWAEEGNTVEATIGRKAEAAAKAGATALILVNAPWHHDDANKLMEPQAGLRRRSDIPVFHITLQAANQMLADAGAPDLATLQKVIDAEGKPASLLLEGVAVEANVEIARSSADARNIVAMLPGSGPHADEYVVIGAHYDHVGKGSYGTRFGSGKIHNGADDNASGTVVMLQLAEQLARAGAPGRSIIFASFTLEELGLIGSAAFVKKMPVPKEKVVAMINLDMVGRIKNGRLYVGGDGTAQAFEPILAAADVASLIEIISIGKGGLGPSDHVNFSRQKIPTLFLYSGTHVDYHGPGDDADKINYEGIAQATALTFDVVQQLRSIEKPAYIAKHDTLEPDTDVVAGELPAIRRARNAVRSRVTLGVEPDHAAPPSTAGVLISAITPDSAAAAAGLQAGDVITNVNERKVSDLSDLTGFLSSAKPGDVVKVTVERGSETVTVEAKLRERQ